MQKYHQLSCCCQWSPYTKIVSWTSSKMRTQPSVFPGLILVSATDNSPPYVTQTHRQQSFKKHEKLLLILLGRIVTCNGQSYLTIADSTIRPWDTQYRRDTWQDGIWQTPTCHLFLGQTRSTTQFTHNGTGHTESPWTEGSTVHTSRVLLWSCSICYFMLPLWWVHMV